MTAAGIAMIAGGIATLIGFRHVLLTGRAGAGRAARGGVAQDRVVRGERHRQDEPATVPSPPTAEPEAAPVVLIRAAAPIRAATPMAAAPRPDQPIAPAREPASLPLRRAAPGRRRRAESATPHRALHLAEPPEVTDDDAAIEEPTVPPLSLVETPAAAPWREGDRIQGWVRPHYEDDEPAAAGEYWMPLPVERFPGVGAYPSRFAPDPDLEPDPDAAMPQWPPAQPLLRFESARRWETRNAQDRSGDDPDRRRSPVRRRTGSDMPVNDADVPRRPRPRPRAGAHQDRSNAYSSRHAADPRSRHAADPRDRT